MTEVRTSRQLVLPGCSCTEQAWWSPTVIAESRYADGVGVTRVLVGADADGLDFLTIRRQPVIGQHPVRVKQAPGWQLEQPEPGVMRWQTPAGRSYTTTATVYEM